MFRDLASKPLVMGILNITPDSFSDGGQFHQKEAALQRARAMIHQGCDILDIGGESTRPGSMPVNLDEEMSRVIPVIEAIRQESDIALSVDTTKPELMQEVLKLGVDMINDVDALAAPGAISVVTKAKAYVCLMHRRGPSLTMQHSPQYNNVVDEVHDFLQSRVKACLEAGISKDKICIDIGFGFGKTMAHNFELIAKLKHFLSLDLPLLVGVSRKASLGELLQAPADKRLAGSLSLAVMAYMKGARIFRVHDVKETVDALKVAQSVMAFADESHYIAEKCE